MVPPLVQPSMRAPGTALTVSRGLPRCLAHTQCRALFSGRRDEQPGRVGHRAKAEPSIRSTATVNIFIPFIMTRGPRVGTDTYRRGDSAPVSKTPLNYTQEGGPSGQPFPSGESGPTQGAGQGSRPCLRGPATQTVPFPTAACTRSFPGGALVLTHSTLWLFFPLPAHGTGCRSDSCTLHTRCALRLPPVQGHF